jgi:hypothetical protein
MSAATTSGSFSASDALGGAGLGMQLAGMYLANQNAKVAAKDAQRTAEYNAAVDKTNQANRSAVIAFNLNILQKEDMLNEQLYYFNLTKVRTERNFELKKDYNAVRQESGRMETQSFVSADVKRAMATEAQAVIDYKNTAYLMQAAELHFNRDVQRLAYVNEQSNLMFQNVMGDTAASARQSGILMEGALAASSYKQAGTAAVISGVSNVLGQAYQMSRLG